MANPRGTAFLLLATSLVACNGSPTAPSPITPPPVTPVEPTEITITVELPYPEDANFNRGVSGITVTCLNGCEDQQVGTTDHLGQVILTGNTPLTIRAEKSGYVSVERQVTIENSTVAIGHEPPPEVEEVIRRLRLTDAVNSGELMIIWADTRYFTGPSLGGLFECYNTTSQAVLVREWRERDFMINTLIHELTHAWQGRNSTRPPCYTGGWYLSASGQAWVAATELDLKEVGPIPGFDDDTGYGKPLSEIPHENHAALHADWYMGSSWGRDPGSVTKADFYRLAPHRSRYLEDRFGPPR